jgi:LacI family transcriptional regulator
MARRSTIADLAEASGVSISTIDRILNGRHPVRKATGDKVLAAAVAIGFYATPALRERLGVGRPVIRLGFLLQQSNRPYYRALATALEQAARPGVQLFVEHMDDLTPEAVAARMMDMGGRVDALAAISAEHPRITQAIEALALQNVPVFGLISGLTAAKVPGRVAILFGNHRYRCQEMNETGFRSYFREHGGDFTLLEPMSTFEDRRVAREVTEDILSREPDLVALYVCGGGITGAMDAIRSSRRKLVTVGHELMEPTRLALMDGVLTMVIAHPTLRMMHEAIDVMCDAAAGHPLAQHLIGFDIFTAENI